MSFAEPVQFYTVIFPPFSSLDQEGRLGGFGVELVTLLQEEMGQNESYDEIIIVPYARAQRVLAQERNAAVFSLYNRQDTQDSWPNIGTVAQVAIGIFHIRPSSNTHGVFMERSQINAALTESIGVESRGFHGDLIANRGGFGNFVRLNSPSGSEMTRSMIRMVLTNRLTAFVGSAPNVQYELDALGISRDRLVVVQQLGVGELVIRLSHQASKEQVAKWSDAFTRMQQRGVLKDIYRKYASYEFALP